MRIHPSQMKQLIRYRPSGRHLLRKSHLLLSQSPQFVSYNSPIMDNVVPSTISPILPLHTTNIQQSSTDPSTSNSHGSPGTEIKVEQINFDDDAPQVDSERERFYDHIFSIDLPEGKCVGLQLPKEPLPLENFASLHPDVIKSNQNHWIRQRLHDDEIQYGINMPSDCARDTFFIGRLSMRAALHLVGRPEEKEHELTLQDDKFSCVSILKDEHGRPTVPEGFLGSISHKKTLGVALVCSKKELNEKKMNSLPTRGIGVDIEQTFSRRRSIAKKILTTNELSNLGNLEGVTKEEEVLLRFSLKESVYKAMHPLINQRVGFQEAEITPHNDGTASVSLNLKSGAHSTLKNIKAHWRRIDDEYFLTSSSVERINEN